MRINAGSLIAFVLWVILGIFVYGMPTELPIDSAESPIDPIIIWLLWLISLPILVLFGSALGSAGSDRQ